MTLIEIAIHCFLVFGYDVGICWTEDRDVAVFDIESTRRDLGQHYRSAIYCAHWRNLLNADLLFASGWITNSRYVASGGEPGLQHVSVRGDGRCRGVVTSHTLGRDRFCLDKFVLNRGRHRSCSV